MSFDATEVGGDSRSEYILNALLVLFALSAALLLSILLNGNIYQFDFIFLFFCPDGFSDEFVLFSHFLAVYSFKFGFEE